MTDITINLEDLETLIFAAAAVKSIEIAIDTRKRDPFVPKEAPIAAALQRLSADARSARRSKETYATPWDGELGDDEKKWLERICKDYDPNNRELRTLLISADVLYGRDKDPTLAPRQGPIHALSNKGMLAIGTAAAAVVWPGADQPEFWPLPNYFYLMPTPRGLRKWREITSLCCPGRPITKPLTGGGIADKYP